MMPSPWSMTSRRPRGSVANPAIAMGLFARVLADIGCPKTAVLAVERHAPRVAQPPGPNARIKRCQPGRDM